MTETKALAEPPYRTSGADFRLSPRPGYTFIVLFAAIALTLLILAASYPGYMSFDSVEELRQARAAVEGSQYPPFGSYVWRVVDWIWPGPALMQLIQNGLLLTSFSYLVSRTRLPMLIQIACICGFTFAPPLFGTMLVVWKDVAVGACYMAALALLICTGNRKSKRVYLYLSLGVFLIWCGIAYRFNAASGAMPLAVLAIHRMRGQDLGQRVRFVSIVSGAVLTVVLFAAVWVLNNYRLPSFERLERNTNSDSIMRYDLIGISVFSGKAIVPGSDGNLVPASYLKAIYDPRHLNITSAKDVGERIAVKIPDLGRLWIRSILENPVAYLHHRIAVFREYIGLHTHNVFYITDPGVSENQLGVTFYPTPFKSYFVAKMIELQSSIFCRPYFYYVVSVALVGMAALYGERRNFMVALFAASSGYLYLAPMFIVTPAADLRYNFWSVAASILASVFAITSISLRVRDGRLKIAYTLRSERISEPRGR
jgi:hypothetical protein